jgi:hypothetical protein
MRASRTPFATWLFSLPSLRRRREDAARWRATSGGVANTSSGDEHGSRRDRRQLVRGGFSPAFPPYLRHDRSRTRAEVRQVRLDQLKLTSLADQRPRSGWSRPRIMETSDTSYFILYMKKIRIDRNKNTWLRVCFRRYRYRQWRGWD